MAQPCCKRQIADGFVIILLPQFCKTRVKPAYLRTFWTFEQLGGYPEIPICEEVAFNKSLKLAGRTVVLDEVLLSSDRKLLREGPIWAFVKNDIIKLGLDLDSGWKRERISRYAGEE